MLKLFFNPPRDIIGSAVQLSTDIITNYKMSLFVGVYSGYLVACMVGLLGVLWVSLGKRPHRTQK